MNTVRWILTVLLGLFWLGSTISNLVGLINARIKRCSTSLILFFGGIAGVLAMLACPLSWTLRWAWAPAVIDLGCIPAGLVIIFAVATGKFRDSNSEERGVSK